MRRLPSFLLFGLAAAVFFPAMRPLAAADGGGRKPTKPSEDPNWNSYSEEVKNQKRQGWAEDKMRRGLGSEFKIEKVAPYIIGANCSEERFARIKNEVCVSFSNAVRKQFSMTHTNWDKRVYVFKKGSDDYVKYAKKLFGGAPPGAAAYALPNEKALLVPDGAGGLGTTQHELVHLLVRDEVREPAIWFDEGFAAFFEQAKVEPSGDSVRVGFHWRLEHAQQAVKSGAVKLLDLPKMSYAQYRGKNENAHYCVGAMVFVYLQEKGGLSKVITAYAETFKADKTGRKAIEKVSGKSFDAFEKEWKDWLLKRKNPPRDESVPAPAPDEVNPAPVDPSPDPDPEPDPEEPAGEEKPGSPEEDPPRSDSPDAPSAP